MNRAAMYQNGLEKSPDMKKGRASSLWKRLSLFLNHAIFRTRCTERDHELLFQGRSVFFMEAFPGDSALVGHAFLFSDGGPAVIPVFVNPYGV